MLSIFQENTSLPIIIIPNIVHFYKIEIYTRSKTKKKTKTLYSRITIFIQTHVVSAFKGIYYVRIIVS